MAAWPSLANTSISSISSLLADSKLGSCVILNSCAVGIPLPNGCLEASFFLADLRGTSLMWQKQAQRLQDTEEESVISYKERTKRRNNQ